MRAMSLRIKNELRIALGVPAISWLAAALPAFVDPLQGFLARAVFLFGVCWMVAYSIGRDVQTGRFQWSSLSRSHEHACSPSA